MIDIEIIVDRIIYMFLTKGCNLREFFFLSISYGIKNSCIEWHILKHNFIDINKYIDTYENDEMFIALQKS